MIALIVDDEKHVRDAIRLLIDWDSHGITELLEASDGRQATQLIGEHQPVLIFMDMMMPVMHGTELLEWIALNAALSKTIVISGHDDFAYVRHAVKYGGIDYLLKPIDAEQLRETVQRAMDSWRQEDRARREAARRTIEANQAKPAYLDRLFSNFIVGSASAAEVRQTLQAEFGIIAGAAGGAAGSEASTLPASGQNTARAAVLSLLGCAAKLHARFGANRELLYFSLMNICNEVLRRRGAGFAFRYLYTDGEIVIWLWESGEAACVDLLEEMNRAIDKTFGVKLSIGLGSSQPFPDGLAESYKSARKAVRSRNLKERGPYVYVSQKETSPRILVHFEEVQEEIRLAVKGGNADQIERLTARLMDTLDASPSLTVDQLEHWWNEYTLFLSNQMQALSEEAEPAEGGVVGEAVVQSFELPVDEDGVLRLSLWGDVISRTLVALSRRLLERQQQENDVIAEITKYIQNHYHESISLQDIASLFFLSREYISRRFKQVTGENVSDYIGRIRIEKAQLLLANPNLRIVQIAQMVGYQDEKYFSKVFKKIAGVGPNEYRKGLQG